MLTLCEDTPSNKIVSDLDAINDANMTRIIPPEILCESICHPPGAYVCQDRVSALRRSPHDGKVIGKDIVTYTFTQVGIRFFMDRDSSY